MQHIVISYKKYCDLRLIKVKFITSIKNRSFDIRYL